MLKKIIISIIVVAVVGAIVFASLNRAEEGPDFVEAHTGNITQEINVTGKVKAVNSVTLAFEKSGRISSLNVDVGRTVFAGQLLATQESSELQAQLAKAEADLATQKAKLDESKVALVNHYASVTDVVNDAFTNANDAVRTQTDEMFTDDETNPQLVFLTNDSQIEIDVENERVDANTALNNWKSELAELGGLTSDVRREEILILAKNRLFLIRNFLDSAWDAVVNTVAVDQTTINSYKTNINTARTSVNSALEDVNNQEQSIAAQKAAIRSQEATVRAQRASIENIAAQIDKTKLYSPIGGIVTVQNTKVGEIVGANVNIISIISESKLEVESFIPEVDIANLKVGNSADITLDAYDSDLVFTAHVSKIDPAETVIEGVSTYKTTLQFDSPDKRIKSGMTANIDIQTAITSDVLVVPQRAVIKQNGDSIVRVLNSDESISEIVVKTGLRGSDGNIEILEGLTAGAKVITFLPEK